MKKEIFEAAVAYVNGKTESAKGNAVVRLYLSTLGVVVEVLTAEKEQSHVVPWLAIERGGYYELQVAIAKACCEFGF